ncbi:MAG: bifunctional 5,10-methylene-tetrahydrofolate dehydrogenase/5,10-methylene-tetrahydrofolate cyclohydrolase [Bacteroidia bacterium]|nr:bifunctional 5,10-methylene-tetrahydrofolate dehydrogenase/5,10-methylene-tetrahydrofolate cyclohydrolase [Bacteroidia bacterium]
MQLIDGKKTAKIIQDEIRTEVAGFINKGLRPPHLVAILVGNDGASQTYVSHKMTACKYVGFLSTNLVFPDDISEEALLAEVEKCNQNPEIDGLIVQLPLPAHIDYMKIILAIRPEKDVDGFHPANVGKMVMGLPTLLPATPYGVMELLKRYKVETKGKNCVVIGRSLIVGTPMSILMGRVGIDGTPVMCHRHTPESERKIFTRNADILIVAVGIPGFIKEDDVKEGVVIIDVGTTRVEDTTTKAGYRLRGDVDFESVSPKCAMITPVPGGVGPMTVTMLIQNTFNTYKARYTSSS